MPTLPTLNITNQSTWDRLLVAFNGDANLYLAWLKEQLKAALIDFEINKQITQRRAEIEAAIDAIT